MSYQLSIEIDIQKTDPNKLLGCSPRLKHRLFKQIKSDIHFLCAGKAPPAPLTSFQISATRHSPRFLDWDNFVASLKPAVDGLKLSGVIFDDSWDYIRHIETNQIKSKKKKLVLEVREV